MTKRTQKQGHWKKKFQCIIKYSDLNYQDKCQMIINAWKESFKRTKKVTEGGILEVNLNYLLRNRKKSIFHCVRAKLLSHIWQFVIPWTVACQSPLFMGFSRQEYWSGLPCPPPQDLPNPGIKLRSPALKADSLPSDPPGMPVFHFEEGNWLLRMKGWSVPKPTVN